MLGKKVWRGDPGSEERRYFPCDCSNCQREAKVVTARICRPAPVVPCLRSDVRRARDCRIRRSLPAMLTSSSAALGSMKPRFDWKGTSCEKMTKASGDWGRWSVCCAVANEGCRETGPAEEHGGWGLADGGSPSSGSVTGSPRRVQRSFMMAAMASECSAHRPPTARPAENNGVRLGRAGARGGLGHDMGGSGVRAAQRWHEVAGDADAGCGCGRHRARMRISVEPASSQRRQQAVSAAQRCVIASWH